MAPRSRIRKHTDVGEECWDCGRGQLEQLKRMFVDVVQARRIRMGQNPALRPVFTKVHGVARGRFEIQPRLPKDLRVGIFGMRALPAWVRFSSDAQPTDPDLKKTCGIGIKLFEVPGRKLLGNGDTHDFILQNHDVFFVDTAKDMCEFTKAGVIDGNYKPYLDSHPITQRVLHEMEKIELSLLTATYWSVLPYAFGAKRSAKYKLEPEAEADGFGDSGNPNYLAADLVQRLAEGEARFRFMVQLRTDPKTMPLDQATVRWSEEQSPPDHVATLILPRQDILARGQAGYGENLAYNPWHALEAHRPQGSISQARKLAYAASSDQRRNANGVPAGEPEKAKPDVAIPAIADDCIVRAAIHPSIGIARIGNSQDEYFLGPEVTDPLPEAPGFYRDGSGALKRQAARFRIYGLNAEGRPVAELTAANAEIRWKVHIANKKAAWYQFQLAQDIPEAASAPTQMLRNITVSDRGKLVIDPGPREISGRNTGGGSEHAFDTGQFMDAPVYLGELKTDADSRLVVLGGRGKSASYNGIRAATFANNEGWHDDVSDGPVTAKVRFQGRALRVDPAWIVVAPPNYAPLQKSVRTMWDLMRDVFITAGTMVRPARPSFDRDIRPIFERLSRLQWVNAGFAASFGWGAPNNFATPDWLARLSQPTAADRETRALIAAQFRVPERDARSPVPWPWTYGDAMDASAPQTPRAFTALSPTQLGMLQQWAAGEFDADYDPAREPPRRLEEVAVAEQPAMLDKASLEFCLAEAFHPGCEMTWPMRRRSLYMAPFRVRHAPPDAVEPSFGAAFTAELLGSSGPLGPQLPGGLTRWMAVPWQTDTASCLSGYPPPYAPYLATFWPARVPNQVLAKENYDIVMDADRSLGERLAAFAARADWLRPLGTGGYIDQINKFVADFGQMGLVEVREGPGDPHFPAVMEVENLPPPKAAMPQAMAALAVLGPQAAIQAEPLDLAEIDKVRRFPHGLQKLT
jgi:L-Lysine epsilon oxidase N-terminal/L-lysine epsilon oxidase C-terminal domain